MKRGDLAPDGRKAAGLAYLEARGLSPVEAKPLLMRSDVCAQLLRVRLYASSAGVVRLDAGSAEEEVAGIGECQADADEPELNGCYYFGKRQGSVARFANPVSTAFCAKALELWQDYHLGRRDLLVTELI